MKRTRWLALVGILALVAAACSPSDSDSSTTTAGGGSTTTAAPGESTTSAPPAAFEGMTLDSGGCGHELGWEDENGDPATYNGKIDTITAVDEHTVEFALCSPDPAFLAKIAFGVFGIQPAEHLEETGGAPLQPDRDRAMGAERLESR
jgi:hypothetical protein